MVLLIRNLPSGLNITPTPGEMAEGSSIRIRMFGGKGIGCNARKPCKGTTRSHMINQIE